MGSCDVPCTTLLSSAPAFESGHPLPKASAQWAAVESVLEADDVTAMVIATMAA